MVKATSLNLVPAAGVAKRKIVKKRKTKVQRWQAKLQIKLKGKKAPWRKPKGIDGANRRRFKGTGKEVKIGYGSNKKTRHLLPNGFYKFVVNNESDLELLLMHNRRYCAEIAHNVGAKKRKAIVSRAQQLGVRVTHQYAKLAEAEDE